MIASERIRHIMDSLNRKGIINLKEIAGELEISETTVRRDFDKLEREGKLKRVSGGATRTGAPDDILQDEVELTMREKAQLNSVEKARVAAVAAQRVQDGDCVFVDGGTSPLPLIEHLAQRRIKLVTHNMLTVRQLKNSVAEIFLVGGFYLPHYSMNVGPMATAMLGQFEFDHAFIGCAGVDMAAGVAYTAEVETMAMKEIGMQHARRSCLLIDPSKLGMRGFCRFKELSAFDEILCNRCKLECDAPANLVWVD